MGDGNTGSDIFDGVGFRGVGFILPIICILIASKGLPQR